jgi:hypothetical protein
VASERWEASNASVVALSREAREAAESEMTETAIQVYRRSTKSRENGTTDQAEDVGELKRRTGLRILALISLFVFTVSQRLTTDDPAGR